MKTSLNGLAFLFAAMLAAATAHGGTMFVDDDAPTDPGPSDCGVSDGEEDGSSEHPFDCIGEAIASAFDGDEIIVAPGTYNEPLDFGGKAITLRSSDGLDDTIIDVTGLGVTAVVFVNGEDEATVMDGFTITGADGGNGGGMYIDSASPTLRNLYFYRNSSSIRGGGLYSEFGHFTMTDCEFRENFSVFGGGMSLRFAQATLINTLFVDNCGGDYAGGIHCAHSSPLMVDCKLQRNEGRDDANGMFIRSNSNPMIINTVFKQNRGRGDGGGIATFDGCSPTIIGCDFDGNKVWWGELNNGGGLMARGPGADPLIVDCRFIRNGILGGSERKGGGMWSSHGASPVVVGCVFEDNFATWGGGAGSETATPTYIDCTFKNNEADLGGALYTTIDASVHAVNCEFSCNVAATGGAVWEAFAGPSVFTNCLFVHNRATLGGAIYSINLSSPTLNNTTMYRNVAERGAALYLSPTSTATINNSILWGNPTGSGHPAIHGQTDLVDASYCLIERGWPGEATFNADPMFRADLIGCLVNRSDVRLQFGSPAIDAGNDALLPADVTDLDDDGDVAEALPVDLMGRKRVLGSAVDLGAFEHSPRDRVPDTVAPSTGTRP